MTTDDMNILKRQAYEMAHKALYELEKIKKNPLTITERVQIERASARIDSLMIMLQSRF